MTQQAMTVERAREVLLEVIELRRRWGQKLSYQDFNRDDLLDALVVLHAHNEETAHAEAVKLKRQLGAAKSRETRGQQQRDELREALASRDEQIAALKKVLVEANEARSSAENRLKALSSD